MKADSLRKLTLVGYKPKSENLEALYQFRQLEQLVLNKSNHRSLDGIAVLSALESAEFDYCRNLESIVGINGTHIKQLVFNNCPKIADLEMLVNCPQLKKLHYNSCRTIKSLQFLDQLPSVQDFTFMGTDIADGNLSRLITLSYSGFDDRKHFSHRYDELCRLRVDASEKDARKE